MNLNPPGFQRKEHELFKNKYSKPNKKIQLPKKIKPPPIPPPKKNNQENPKPNSQTAIRNVTFVKKQHPVFPYREYFSFHETNISHVLYGEPGIKRPETRGLRVKLPIRKLQMALH